MKKKKQPDIINQITMSIEDFYKLKEKVDRAYNSAGFEDITPDEDYENDIIHIVDKNGYLSVKITIKLSSRETIEII